MAATLYFDGDKRRIYEVPDNSQFVTDSSGYRIYTPIDPNTAAVENQISVYKLWSDWVDYHNLNKWALLAFDISGGAYRYTDSSGNDVYALPDLRLLNDWQLVPADYPHNFVIIGNLYPNTSTGKDFDVSRITSQGVSPRILFSDRGERSIVVSSSGTGGNITQQEIADAVWNAPKSNHTLVGTMGEYLQKGVLSFKKFMGIYKR